MSGDAGYGDQEMYRWESAVPGKQTGEEFGMSVMLAAAMKNDNEHPW